MPDIVNTENNKYSERSERKPNEAILNPDSSRFQQILAQSSHSILEIGCGTDVRVSWGLDKGDLWVGCDPAINSWERDSINVRRGARIDSGARLVVFSDIAADIPKFKPDILCAVAPNQKDIVDGNIFNDELGPFLDPAKQQYFIVELDTRTREARGYQNEAKRTITVWMKENKFRESDPHDSFLYKYNPNSADLGGSNVRWYFVRNPR